jgi:purine nucleosidase
MTLWIDCDPGIDDAIALLLALASPDLDLRGISTVAGNVPVTLTSANGLRILELAHCTGVPLYAGCPVPLCRSPIFAADIHGEDGLGGVDLPPPQIQINPLFGVTALSEALRQSPTPITIATLGPLTNLAITLIQDPALAEHIEQLVIMGGALGQGNITSAAEFNFYADPHAAQIVFDRIAAYTVPTTVIGLDLTHQVIATPAYQQRIADLNTPVSRAVVQMLATYGQTPEALERKFAGPPLHDPCVIAYLLQPQLFQTRSAHLAIETQSPLTLGRSVIQWTIGDSPIQVATHINVEGFFDLLITALQTFPA